MDPSRYFLLFIILTKFPSDVITECEHNFKTFVCQSLYSPSIIKISRNNYINELIIRDSLISTLSLNIFRDNYGLYSFKDINKIYVTNCSLSKLTNFNIQNIPLKVFDLTNNALLDIDTLYLNKFKSLMSLNVSNNYISTLDTNAFQKLDNLLHLNVSGNKLNKLPDRLEGLSALQTFDLSRNKLNFLNINFFSEMIKLNKLNLQYNNISELHSGLFKRLSSLYYLNLSHNNITILSLRTFIGLSNLTELDISYNNIITIDDILFHNTPNLKKFYIAFNQLTKLELVGILDAAKLSVIDFDGNDMSCQVVSEMLKTLRKYSVAVIKGSSVDDISIYGIKCFETFTNQDKKLLESNITEYKNVNGIYLEHILSKFSENFTGNLENLWNNVTAIMDSYLENRTAVNLEQINGILDSVQMTFEKFINKLEFQSGENGSKKTVPMGDTELSIFSKNLTILLNKYNNDLSNIKFDHDVSNNNMNRFLDKLQQMLHQFEGRPETVLWDNFADKTKTEQSSNLSNILYGLITVAVLILISCIIIIALFSLFFLNKKNTFNVNELQEII